MLPQAEFRYRRNRFQRFIRVSDYSNVGRSTDDCTFWYTTEYYTSIGTNWQTRIGSFKFPTCNQPKGFIEGYVRNSVTSTPIAGVKVDCPIGINQPEC
jgi:hypothetical protein